MAESHEPSNEALLTLFFSLLSDFAILLMDRDGNLRSWHPGVESQLGYRAGEFIGRNGEMLVPLAQRLRGAFRQELQKAAEAGRASDNNWLLTRSGRPIFVEGVSLALRDPASGDLLGFGKILHDTTKQKQVQGNLRALTQMLDESIVYIHNWDGVIEHWTAGCERLFGFTRDEAVGHPVGELLKIDHHGAEGSIKQHLLEHGNWRGQLQQQKKDGTPLAVSAHWALLRNEREMPSIITTNTDVTSLVSMQGELEAANLRLQSMAVELERSNAELEEFARIASHDLSAPLTSTRWLVELLTARHGSSLDQDGQTYLQQIALGLQRMADLVEAILKHAVVGTNAISASEPASADDALNIAIENLQKDLTTSGATITREPLPHLFIGPQFLAQLFQNLLSNAVKYRRRDTPLEIRIEAEFRDPLWAISVADNGIGIEPEWLERVFLPMQRRHGANIAGSGIGLATCRKIVNRAGGRIWVESEAELGSTFFFLLPGPK